MRFLVVGLGSMGKRRIRNLKDLGAERIVGMDPRPDRREEVAMKYHVPTFATLDEAFDQGVDAVVISTPPDLHIACALEAARRDKHFFTEASVVDDGVDELLDLISERGIVGVPSCTMRYFAGPRKIGEIVEGGAIGEPLSFFYQSGQWLPDWHPWEDYRSFYVSRRQTGACREIVPFELTWLVHRFGAVASVQAFKGKLTSLDADIDDVYQLLLQFASGVAGVLQVDVIARAPVRHFRLLGTKGTVEWDGAAGEVRLYSARQEAWETISLERGTVENAYAEWAAEEPYVEEMRDFIAAIEGKRRFGHSFEQDSRLLDCLRAAERSHAEGVRVCLPGPPREN